MLYLNQRIWKTQTLFKGIQERARPPVAGWEWYIELELELGDAVGHC